MKKLFLLSAIALSGLFYNTANAQIRVHLGINLWPPHVYVRPVVDVQTAPVVYADDDQADYNNNDDYYYLPDVNAYYSVSEQCYYYNDGDNWISAAYLPGYRDYDWRNARRYEVHAARPYMHNDFYMNKYHGANNNNWAHNNNSDRGGYAQQQFNNNRSYAQPQPYNNRNHDNNGQGFDNRGDKQRFTQNNRGNQQRVAQNNAGAEQRGGQNNRGDAGHDRMNRF